MDFPNWLLPQQSTPFQSCKSYTDLGFVLTPIAPGTKSPMGKDWNKRENCFDTTNPAPEFFGVGLCHAYSGTMALDIDHWDRAAQDLTEAGIDLLSLYSAPDAVIIESGKSNHGKLLYRMPAGMVLNSKKLLDKDQDSKKFNYLDFRCGTANGHTVQDVLPGNALHPDTGKPYRWAGKGHYSRLPEIPFLLLLYWQSLLNKDAERVIETGVGVNASWHEIQSALDHISPDCSRQEWVSVGCALKWAGEQTGQDEQALHLWDDWSKRSGTKYKGEKEILSQWTSFRNDKTSLVKLGTLYHMAKEAGWVRPMPDVADLFKGIPGSDTPAAPAQVTESLKPPPPKLDMSLFPKVLATRATEISEQVGCDPLVPLWAGLAATCSVIDARSRLELMPGFSVPPVLWLMTIGDPSDKKSPGSRPMFSVLDDLEKEDRPLYSQRLLDFEATEMIYKATKQQYMEQRTGTEALLGNTTTISLGPEPVAPQPLKIKVSDVTSQKLIDFAAANPRGLLCYLDEMNTWVKRVTEKNTAEDRSAWVSGFEAQRYEMSRRSIGTVAADNYALSIYGNIQPKVLRQNMEALACDGLLQRFMPAVLRSDQTRLGHPVPDWMTTRATWENKLRFIYAMPTMELELEKDAYLVFRKFQSWYEQAKGDYRTLGVTDEFMTAFGKLEGVVGRLAMVFHFLENSFSYKISSELLEKVIRFVKEYLIPAYRYTFGEVGGADTFDSWVADHVIQIAGEKDTVSLSEIKRSARRQLEKVQPWQADRMVTDAMETLVQCRWVAVLDENPQKKHIVWAINGMLATVYTDQRQRVLAARVRQYGTHGARGDKQDEQPGSG